jgi:hypothetical protein
MTDRKETIVLRTERGAAALPLLRVVVRSAASRQNLTMDQIDDVQLAIETLVAEEPEVGGELVLEVWPDADGLSICLDGLVNESVKAALIAAAAFEPCEGCLLDVRVMLESLVDAFIVQEKAEGSFAVQLAKRA